ncbi:MAG TPA: PVC-type heme-binding CxxCH protein [Pirellulaceae bacterium]|nr:PVC-type heme-binding CxxCH protein [Pirellulaceae bacterium]
MMRLQRVSTFLLSLLIGIWSLVDPAAAGDDAVSDKPTTGPATEKLFPPLVVPDGFQATLFACDPLIEYPSAIAVGPKDKPGSIFVAIDYMTGLGTEIVRRDEIRLIEDVDRDGYADKATVYAGGFNSIMGMTFHGDTLYVMHAPFLTSLRDANGDGKADERRDLLSGLGLPPEENDVRLHCANGVAMGHDGWLYLALGDHGCDVPRPEGDRLNYHGGGILRCRRDGRDLHLFAGGLRNIYDVALDDDLNVFVRDNENDGGDYKIRVCYSFHGADHGYPYLYYERPEEALPPLADLGLGSSAGGAAYLERHFPVEYHGSLFFCEWGKSVVNYRPQRAGCGFAPLAEIQFAAGAENDPYGFKPTDLIVDRDGSLVVADWCDGQRPKRGRGRVYRITHRRASASPAKNPSAAGRTPAPQSPISQLDSQSYFERVEAQDEISARGREGIQELREALDEKNRFGVLARTHAVWIFARDGSEAACEKLFELAEYDDDARVQVQAVRALADLYDPALAGGRLHGPSADPAIAARLAKLAVGKDPRVLLAIVIAVGRLKWPESPEWLRKMLAGRRDVEPFLAHAAMQTLRRSGNWPLVLPLLDLPGDAPIRTIALRAVSGQYESEIAAGLIERLDGRDVQRRLESADALARIWKRPGPWAYWGYRPSPRAANSVTWDQTEMIDAALNRLLENSDNNARLAVLRQLQREQVPPRLETLATWGKEERSAEAVSAILASLAAHPVQERRAVAGRIVRDRLQSADNRLWALALVAGDEDEIPAADFVTLARSLEDGEVLTEFLKLAPDHRNDPSHFDRGAAAILIDKLQSPDTTVRTAAIAALVKTKHPALADKLLPLLDDPRAPVRAAAASAAGRLKVHAATERLLVLAARDEPLVRAASLEALTALGQSHAAPLAAQSLDDPLAQAAALACMAELGSASEMPAVIELSGRDLSEPLARLAARALARWQDQTGLSVMDREQARQALSKLQGRSGLIIAWRTSGPLSSGQELEAARKTVLPSPRLGDQRFALWPLSIAAGHDDRVILADDSNAGATYLASADVFLLDPASVQFLASASGSFRVWLNGKQVYQQEQRRGFSPESDRFDVPLPAGLNRIVVEVTSAGGAAFHLRFRRKNSTAQHERLMQAALSRTGDVERGRKLFLDATKTQCIKCHRIDSHGERVGPELTGLGDRFSRIHIVESILEPSRTVTPGFQTLLVRLADGRTISGIKIAEDERMLTLADQKGEKHALAKTDIEEQKPQMKSTMPDNLAQQFNVDQFVDLITFLVSQKQHRPGAAR